MRSLLVAASLICVAAFPTIAHADSIVYVKDGHVWIANTDMSGARQFTTYAFNWHSPSEADDGTVVAAGGPAHGDYGDPGSDLYRFSGDGNQIGGAIPTQGTYSTLSCMSYAPTGVRVSPDATKIAYSSFLCGSQENTAFWTPSTATGLDFPNQTLGQQDFWQPAWQDNTHFLVSHAGPTVTSSQAQWFLHDVADGDDVGPGWNEPTMSGTGAQGLVSRDGKTLAVFEDDAADHFDGLPTFVHLWVYTAASLGDAEAGGWTKRCELNLDASKTTHPLKLSPSFSPDGSKLLWADDDGVRLASLGDTTNSCDGFVTVPLIPGASDPFYSKGNLQPAAANPNQPGAPTSTDNTNGGGSTQGPGTNPAPLTAPAPGATPTPSAVLKLIARFVVRTKQPTARHKVAFDAGSSKETGGRIVSYKWTFGDKKKASGRKVGHVFKKRGKYKVVLVVRDARGNSAKISHVVKVR